MVYEPLLATDRVLCWNMLPRSAAPTLSQRRNEDAETTDEVAQCFLAQRNLDTLSDRPWTKEWLEAAVSLCLSQPESQPLGSLLDAFRVGSTDYERLLRDSQEPAVIAKFREMERLRRRNVVQYELQTGASRRLLELVCTSEVVRLRSRPGPFDWLAALRAGMLIAFDGGGIRSKELKRTLFLLATIQVIHAVRRHFATTQQPLPVVLVLEEAGALRLVTPFVLGALQELRKAGLALHLITQSCLDFGDRTLFEVVLGNTPWQAWYQCLSPADQELGAKALANVTFDPLMVHFTRKRWAPERVRVVSAESRAATCKGYRDVVEPHYKTPQLQEQEYRTALANLRIGERFVRDRVGVRRERVALACPPPFRRITDAGTREIIDRIRRQPIYLPPPPTQEITSAETLPDAAERLRERGSGPDPMPAG